MTTDSPFTKLTFVRMVVVAAPRVKLRLILNPIRGPLILEAGSADGVGNGEGAAVAVGFGEDTGGIVGTTICIEPAGRDAGAAVVGATDATGVVVARGGIVAIWMGSGVCAFVGFIFADGSAAFAISAT